MIRRPPRSTRTDTLFPDTTPFRSEAQQCVKLSLTNRSIGLIPLASGNGAGNTNIVASSDQFETLPKAKSRPDRRLAPQSALDTRTQIGRASCRARVCQYV